MLFLNHVLIDPPVDRAAERVDVRDVFVSLDRSDDNGIYVSGAKMVATGSALTHATFVAVNCGVAARMEPGRDDDMALVFIIDMNTPGVKLICRPSYEAAARSPFEAPLASRFDENDAVVVFEEAFIPWENVLVYRDVALAKGFYAESGFFNRLQPPGVDPVGGEARLRRRAPVAGDRGGGHPQLPGRRRRPSVRSSPCAKRSGL